MKFKVYLDSRRRFLMSWLRIGTLSLLTGAASAGTLDVAILAADSAPKPQDVQSKLLATGQFDSVDIIDVQHTTPTLAQLQNYSAVLVYKNWTYADSTSLGNTLADYYDAGGGVVCTVFETASNRFFLGGRWASGPYHALARGGIQFTYPGLNEIGTIYDSSHPVVDGVTTFTAGARPNYTGLTPSSFRIADYVGGFPLAAAKPYLGHHIVDLGFFAPSTDVTVNAAWTSATNGDLIMANALVFVASPVVKDDLYNALEDTPLAVSAPGVMANDFASSASAASVELVAGPSNGLLDLQSDGSFTYNPNPNFNGVDTFTYRIIAGTLESSVATVQIQVGGIGDAPIASQDAFTATEDTILTATVPGVLGNDVDGDGDSLSALIVTSPHSGSLFLNGDGSFAYVPEPNFTGIDYFTYRASDGVFSSADTTVTITVGPVADAPVAEPDSYELDEDTSLTISVPGVLANDTDPDGDNLTAELVTETQHGIVLLDADGVFSYVPDADYFGSDSFTYRATDGELHSPDITVTLTINSINDFAVPNDDYFSATEQQPLIVAAPGVLGNDTDTENEELSAFVVEAPLSGTLNLASDGGFTYTPDVAFNGTDIFRYLANDGHGNSTTGTVYLAVLPHNDAPVAMNDQYVALEDNVLQIAASNGVMLNDSDEDKDLLIARLIKEPLHGSINLNLDGSFEYTPDINYRGSDRFTYQANDGFADSNIAVVSIDVGSVNDGPVAVADLFGSYEEQTLSIAAPGILSNDVDNDEEPLSSILLKNPSNGTLVLDSDGSFVYTPYSNFAGTDEFLYKINDGHTESAATTVTIQVGNLNDSPVAVDDALFVLENQTVDLPAAGILANDFDADSGDTLSAQLIRAPLHGTLNLQSDGALVYTPTALYHGADDFVYRAFDGAAFSKPATVTITVQSVNTKPVLTNVIVNSINESGTATVSGTIIDPNFSDAHQVTVNWGNNTAPDVVQLVTGMNVFNISRQFADDNPTSTPLDTHTVQVLVQDGKGGIDSHSVPLTVANVAPRLYNVVITPHLPVKSAATLVGTWSDPGASDSFDLLVNWGDGSPLQTVHYLPGTDKFELSHAYAMAGNYNVQVDLTDDDNGSAQAQTMVSVSGQADLQVSCAVAPDTVRMGALVTYNLMVKNNGPGIASNVRLLEQLPEGLQVQSSSQEYIVEDNNLVFSLGTLNSGTSRYVQIEAITTATGTLSSTAKVEADEDDPAESNNLVVTNLVVTPANGPDLEAALVTISQKCKSRSHGQKCTVNGKVLITNSGNLPADKSGIALYLSQDAMLDPGDRLVKSSTVKALSPGKSQLLKVRVKLPNGVTTSGMYIIAVVDPNQRLEETNENNNRSYQGPLL